MMIPGLVLVALLDISITQYDPQNVDFLVVIDLHSVIPSEYAASPPTTVITTLPFRV